MNRNQFWALILGIVLLLPMAGFSRQPETAPFPIKAIPLSELPSEARLTVRLIREGGPFRYSRDGVVFHNRERLLPLKKAGYYREYTVPTPGGKDRGARRIISGRDGELYYTADHYSSFIRIRE